MKLKSLILGSVAAVGLSTASFAADPLGILTSLDTCDALGLSGLTVSSDTNCLQVSGGITYEFNWGDFAGTWNVIGDPPGAMPRGVRYDNGLVNRDDNNSFPGVVAVPGVFFDPADPGAGAQAYDAGDVLPPDAIIIEEAVAGVPADPDANQDWNTKVEAWLKFVGTADSDFGPAAAHIKLKSVRHFVVTNEQPRVDGGDNTGNDVILDQAWVQVGDSTVIMAGKKGSIANVGDDEPFNWLGLFRTSKVDTGVFGVKDAPKTGGHVIQIVSDLGNGVNVGLGLENIDGDTPAAGTLVGVVSYAGEGVTAHVTGLAGGIFDGVVENYAVHAGATATFDAFTLRGAFAATHNQPTNVTVWHAMASARAALDIFTVAVSGEADGYTGEATNFGAGASIGANVTDGVALNLGGRFYNDNEHDNTGYQVAAQLVASVTETIKLTGEVGVYGRTNPADTDWYGRGELAWAPGGGFTSSIAGQVQQNGAYKVTFKAAKEFN